jgi:hypothetical protein
VRENRVWWNVLAGKLLQLESVGIGFNKTHG